MLRTLVFFSWFWFSLVLTLPVCLVYVCLKVLGLNAPIRRPVQWAIRTWARSQVAATGMRVHAEGLDRIPPAGRVCLVANHPGDMDIILVLALVERTVGFVTKLEGLFMPIVNLWIIALDSVFLDRKNLARGKRSIDRGVLKIGHGSAMIVFPEGTRSRGDTVLPFRHGSFKLATRAEALVVPISISGTAGVWEKRKRITPATVSFIVHEPIPTAGMGPEERRGLAERVRSVIVAGLDRATGTGMTASSSKEAGECRQPR